MTWQDVEKGLGSEDTEERRRAASLLGQERGSLPLGPIVRALGDDDWRVRKEAIAAVVERDASPELVRGLIAALAPGPNVGLRNAVVDALAGIGPAAIGPLGAALPGLDADGRKLVVEALGQSGRVDALPPLARALADADPNVRAAAAEALATIGVGCAEDVIPLLEDCLAADESFLRFAALDGLNQLGAVLPWERIRPLFDDPVLRAAAVVAAGRSGDERAAVPIARQIQDGSGQAWEQALAAAAELAQSGRGARLRMAAELSRISEPAQGAMVQAATSSDAPVVRRRLALGGLGLLGSDQAARVAVEALGDDAVAGEAERALTDLGIVALDALVAGASASSAAIRARSVELLAGLSAVSRPAAAAVRAALDDDEPEVVTAALTALAEAGDASGLEPAAQWLVGDTPPTVRSVARRALASLARRHPARAREIALRAFERGTEVEIFGVVLDTLGPPLGPNVHADIELLAAALADERSSVRRAAVRGLGGIGSELVLEPVMFALADDDPEVRVTAVRALGRLRGADGSAIAFDRLAELAQRPEDPALAAAAARALGDSEDPRAFTVLGRLLSEPGAVAVAALEAVAASNDPRRVELVIAALSHCDPEVVKAALAVACAERDPRVTPHLAVCVDHPAWDVRRLAVELLGKQGGETALAVLRSRLGIEQEPLVLEGLAIAIAEAEAGSGRRITVAPASVGGRRLR